VLTVTPLVARILSDGKMQLVGRQNIPHKILHIACDEEVYSCEYKRKIQLIHNLGDYDLRTITFMQYITQD